MTSAVPHHVREAPTWSEMLRWWRGSSDPAVVSASAVVTGDELLRKASGAARHLRDLTAGPAPMPALVTSNAAAVAYAIGGAECARPLAPLGPRLTASELGPVIDALGSDVLLVDPEFAALGAELAAGRSIRVVALGAEDGPVDELALDPSADDIAFVLHTSGTTGVPKAVAYRQGQLAERTRVNTALCGFAPGCTYATASPFHHIAGFGNHAVALAAGAAIAPVPRFSVEAWRALAAVHVTHALTVPTMLELLLEADALALPELRTLQYGGSSIHPDTLRRTLQALRSVAIVNIYGQTEGSPITCLTADDHRRIVEEARDDLLESVGRPAAGIEVRIEGPDGDGIGEVVARGSHLFLPDRDGWLRTGDLGRIDDDGYVFLVGRRGDRIIRGGENIYPLEVEQVLEQHPQVSEAAVVGVDDRRWGETVRAVIVPVDPIDPPSAEALQLHARAALARFKVPTEWVFTDELPRNAAGKLLRRSLNSVY